MTEEIKKVFVDKMKPGTIMYMAICSIVFGLIVAISVLIANISNLVLIVAVVLIIIGAVLMFFTPQMYCLETKNWAETVIGWYDTKEEQSVVKAIEEENFTSLENLEIAKDAGNMVKVWVRYCPKTNSIAEVDVEKYVEWNPSNISPKKIIRGDKVKTLVNIISKNDNTWNG